MLHTSIIAAPLLNVEAEREMLLSALDYLARRVVEQRSTVPILANVRIEASYGALILSACNLDIDAVVEIAARVEHAGVCTVGAHALRDLVKSAPKRADVRLSIDATGADDLIFQAGRCKSALPTLPASDVPRVIIPVGGHAFDIPAARFASDMARIAPFMSRDGDSYHLCGMALESEAGALSLVATDRHNLASLTRSAPDGVPDGIRAILPAKLVAALQAALKAFPCESVRVDIAGTKVLIEGNAFILCGKLIEGTFPAWRSMFASHVGDGAQVVMDVALEPRLSGDAMTKFVKACGPLIVEIGNTAARLTMANTPEFLALSMLLKDADATPKGYSYGIDQADANRAREYLQGQRARYGMVAIGAGKLVVEAGRVVGMTYGDAFYQSARWEERPNYETFQMERVNVQDDGLVYPDGAYSVFMPQAARIVVAAVTVEVDGVVRPLLRHDTKGTLHASAEQIAAWCGPIDPSTNVAIAPLPMVKAWWRKDAPALAPKPCAEGASAAEMTAYAETCQRAADLHNAWAVDASPMEDTAPNVATVPVAASFDADGRKWKRACMSGSSAKLRYRQARQEYGATQEPTLDPIAVPTPVMETADADSLPAFQQASSADAPADVIAAMSARIAALESIVDDLMVIALRADTPARGNDAPPVVANAPAADVTIVRAPDPRARAVAKGKGAVVADTIRARRLRIVRRYLAMRRALAEQRAGAQRIEVAHHAALDTTQAQVVRAERGAATWRARATEAGWHDFMREQTRRDIANVVALQRTKVTPSAPVGSIVLPLRSGGGAR